MSNPKSSLEPEPSPAEIHALRCDKLRAIGIHIDDPVPVAARGPGVTVLVDAKPYARFATRKEADDAIGLWRIFWPASAGRLLEVA